MFDEMLVLQIEMLFNCVFFTFDEIQSIHVRTLL